MIWHFADLGMDVSIYSCGDGSVNSEADATPGDCKLSTKEQPQWADNWLADPIRGKIYSDWSRFIDLKKNEPVFEGNYAISPNGSALKQRIYIFDTYASCRPDSECGGFGKLLGFGIADHA